MSNQLVSKIWLDLAYQAALKYEHRTILSLEDVPLKYIQRGILGGSSILDLERGIKYKLSSSIVGYINDTPISRSEVTVAYLEERIRGLGRRKMPYLRGSMDCLTWKPPMMCRPGVYENHVLVDIAKAYPSIYCAIGLDCQLIPHKGVVGEGAIKPWDFPLLGDKSARSALYGLTRSMLIRRIHRGEVLHVKRRSSFLNPSLHGAIMYVLHDIAQKAASLGACYIHTDGYILPADSALELWDYIFHWGLVASTKSEVGPAIIRALGAYRVGGYESIPYGSSPRMIEHALEPLERKPEIIARLRAIIGTWAKSEFFTAIHPGV